MGLVPGVPKIIFDKTCPGSITGVIESYLDDIIELNFVNFFLFGFHYRFF